MSDPDPQAAEAQPKAGAARHAGFLPRGLDTWLAVGAAAILLASVMPLGARLAWALELSTHFRLQYLIAALAMLGVLAVRRRYAWCGALAAAAVLNALPLAPYLPRLHAIAVADRPAGGDIGVMAVNVWSRNTEYARLIELVEDAMPDVLLLVEYDGKWAAALEPLHQAYPHRIHAPREDDFGIALYSRHPLSDARKFDLLGTSAVDARVTAPAGHVRVLGVHLTAPTSPARAARRNRQLRQLAALRAAIEDPLVVMGDFNVTPFSPYFTDWIAETGLRSAAAGRGPTITWPALFPVLGIPIDHCMLSAELTVTAYRRLPAFGSDHYPVLTRFVVTETS